jgi:predicted nucleic acid-binding protein
LRDDEEKSSHCLKFLEKVDEGEVEAATSLLILNEVLWVLEGLGVEKEDIVKRLKAIAMSNVEILRLENSSTLLESLGYYDELGVDFIDALNSCIARENNLKRIVTYDEHFKKLAFVEGVDPSAFSP